MTHMRAERPESRQTGTDQFRQVSELTQLLREGNQFVVAGDQNLERQTADHRRQNTQLVPTGEIHSYIITTYYYYLNIVYSSTILI